MVLLTSRCTQACRARCVEHRLQILAEEICSLGRQQRIRWERSGTARAQDKVWTRNAWVAFECEGVTSKPAGSFWAIPAPSQLDLIIRFISQLRSFVSFVPRGVPPAFRDGGQRMNQNQHCTCDSLCHRRGREHSASSSILSGCLACEAIQAVARAL